MRLLAAVDDRGGEPLSPDSNIEPTPPASDTAAGGRYHNDVAKCVVGAAVFFYRHCLILYVWLRFLGVVGQPWAAARADSQASRHIGQETAKHSEQNQQQRRRRRSGRAKREDPEDALDEETRRRLVTM